MNSVAPLWAATALSAVLTSAAVAVASITQKKSAALWAAALAALSLRVAAAHFELLLGPSWPLHAAARCASPLFALLFLAGVDESYGGKLLGKAIPAAVASLLWLLWSTAVGLTPLASTAPAELLAGALCAGTALAAPQSRPRYLNATLWLLALRALCRPFLFAYPLTPLPTLFIATLLWGAPTLGIIAAVVSSLKRDAVTERARGEALAESHQTGVAVVDGGGLCVYANAQLASMLGQSAPETAGSDVAATLSASGFLFQKLPLAGGAGGVIVASARTSGKPDPSFAGKLFEFASAIGDGAALVSPDTGKTLMFSGLFREILPADADGFGADFWSAAMPGKSAPFREAVLSASSSGATFEAEVRGSDGKGIRVRLAVTEVEWDSSLLLQVTATRLPDRTREKLETSGELAAGLAHDLKNVLQAILSCSDGLAASGPSDKAAVKAIADAAKKGDGLVRRILDPSRARPDAKRFDLAALVGSLEPLAQKSSQAWTSCEFSLPAGALVVIAAPEEVEQAVMNLIVNAREALGGGGRVVVTAASEGGNAIVKVEDSGPGVTEEMKERIFQPLFSTKGRAGGLGLAMVRAMAERFGGRVEVGRSTALGGAAFTLTLPLAPPGAVLLADSDDAARALLDRELKLAGRVVHSTPNGDRALQLLKEKGDEISTVVADLVLEGTGGRRFLERAAALKPGARIIVVSSITSEAARVGSLKAGACIFLAKPAAVRRIMDSIGSA